MGGPISAAALISAGRTRLGWLYALGAGLPGEPPSPPYIDCGELIRQSLHDCGVVGIQRTITAQVAAAPWTHDVQSMPWGEVLEILRPGDCIAYDWPGGFAGRPYDHGGIWTGSKLLHASSSQGKVVEVAPPTSGWKTLYSFTRGGGQ